MRFIILSVGICSLLVACKKTPTDKVEKLAKVREEPVYITRSKAKDMCLIDKWGDKGGPDCKNLSDEQVLEFWESWIEENKIEL